VLIPVAMLGFLNPLFAGAAMALSSVFVVTNSLRLRGFKAERSGAPERIARSSSSLVDIPNTRTV